MSGPKKDRDAASSDGDGALGFFERIFSLILGAGDPERDKKRILKAIGKDLARDKFKLYKPKSGEIEPNFARMLYEVYKNVAAVRQVIQPTDTGGALKSIVIELHMTEQQGAIRDRLDPKHIREQARSVDVKQLSEAVRDDLLSFVGSFDADRVRAINQSFSNVNLFLGLCHFDYYFTLKKFDSAISEGSFTYKPNWESISAEYVIDDIRDFLEVVLAIPDDFDWDDAFAMIATYKGVELVDRGKWKRVWKTVSEIVGSGVLEKIVQHASGDPGWVARRESLHARIVEPYINEIKGTVESTLQQLVAERRNSKIEQLVKQVFGTGSVHRAKNYTDKANAIFSKTQTGGYLYTDAFNYLKAYLIDVFKKEMREIVQDLLIVRGKWTTNIQSQQLSDSYHALMHCSAELIRIDDGLSDENELGQKVRRAVGRVVERDPSTQRLVMQTLKEINDEVLKLINEAGQNLVSIGKTLKLLITDLETDRKEVILNWKELDAAIEDSLKDRMAKLYRQVYYLVQLLQIYTSRS